VSESAAVGNEPPEEPAEQPADDAQRTSPEADERPKFFREIRWPVGGHTRNWHY
jgi:hypothetical protein